MPIKFRNEILKMAHARILVGHQGIQKSMNSVLEEFWPADGANVRRFVKSSSLPMDDAERQDRQDASGEHATN